MIKTSHAAAAIATSALTLPHIQGFAQETKASESPWVMVIATKKTIFEIDTRSPEYGTTDEGMPYILASGRGVNKATYQIRSYGWALNYTKCPDPDGNLIIVDVEDSSTTNNSFVTHGNTVASSIAAILCLAHKMKQEAMIANKTPNS